MDLCTDSISEEEVKDWFYSILQWKDRAAETDLEKVETSSKLRFTFIVSYRGRWCGYCRHYIGVLREIYPELKKKGGRVVLYTSQKQKTVDRTSVAWKLPFDHIISDPKNKIARLLKAEGFKAPVVAGEGGDKPFDSGALRQFAKSKGFEHGFVLPSVLVVDDSLRTLFYWRVFPTWSNGGGASDRPDLKQIFDVVKKKSEDELEVEKVTNLKELKQYTKVKMLKLLNPKILLFMFRRSFCCCLCPPSY